MEDAITRPLRQIVAVIAVSLMTLGCSQQQSQQTKQLEQLSQDLAAAKTSLEARQGMVRNLRVDVRESQTDQAQYRSATFDPTEKGFSRLDTSVGSFAVSIHNVQPYADGIRVSLNVGNLGTATVHGGTFGAKGGSRMPKLQGAADWENWSAKHNEWLKALREKKIDFGNDLRSGTWNRVTLDLPGVPPARFGYLELTFEASSISLIQPR